MITDAIINVLLALPLALLHQLDNLAFSFSIPDEVYNTLRNLTAGVAYVLPVWFLVECAAVRIAVHLWRLPYAIVIRIKSFIPTISGS